MPNVENGMGAVLFCRGGRPDCLEIVTFGDASWDGVLDGFSITSKSKVATEVSVIPRPSGDSASCI